jgi:hypothetical protein
VYSLQHAGRARARASDTEVEATQFRPNGVNPFFGEPRGAPFPLGSETATGDRSRGYGPQVEKLPIHEQLVVKPDGPEQVQKARLCSLFSPCLRRRTVA